VETNLASANVEMMQLYSGLVDNDKIRKRFSQIIADEFGRTQEVFEHLFGGTLSARRPRMVKTLQLREEPLRVLHHQQVQLLSKWRSLRAANDTDTAERLRPQLLLSINAIASGLRTTG
jgi:phosphoenolpyruvate carboxylase